MWKISYDLSGSTEHIQQIMEIDAEIEKLGEKIDYSKSATVSLFVLISHFVVCFIRVLVVCISMGNRKASLHYSKLFQITFSDSLSFTVTNYFCTYLYALRDRYKRINQVLMGLGTRTDKNLFVRNKNLINVYRMEDRYVCKKINACGKVYSMLFKASETANDKFGFALLLTMFVWLIMTVLYLYYFMEATAAGLFHDVQRYIYFLVYVSWQIIFAVAIISSAIYFCENIVKEAKLTSYLVHTVISDTWDISVKEEALRLSIQIVHQTPKFTARGLFIVEYELLLEVGNYIKLITLEQLISFQKPRRTLGQNNIEVDTAGEASSGSHALRHNCGKRLRLPPNVFVNHLYRIPKDRTEH
ncbi:unnamed protein product [Pieris brassicae]|uniref:Gustatory receptor n=1 Tax=Pieris brassicae TaxID=7116 RepID=A0A9P0X939_PIEBR|nr:unnamed protein product [Pieris brassicae]